MRLFIFGKGSFGAAVLDALIHDGHEVLGCAAAPQAEKKDRLYIQALRRGVPCADPETFKAEMVPEGVDLIVAAHSHHFISAKVRGRAKFGAIGYHPSALPRHRGRDAVRWTVAMREPVTAGTVYVLDDTVDGGPVVLQKLQLVGQAWDYHRLWREMFPAGVELVTEAVKAYELGLNFQTRQDESLATWEPAFDRQRLYRPELIGLPAKT